MRIEEVIGQRMKAGREYHELTQEQVGERLGELLGKPWSRQSVSLAEQGRRAFTAVEIAAIAYVVNTSVSRLFTPPAAVRKIEFPTGMSVPRTELLETALPGTAVAEPLKSLRENLTTLGMNADNARLNADNLSATVEAANRCLDLAIELLMHQPTEGESR